MFPCAARRRSVSASPWKKRRRCWTARNNRSCSKLALDNYLAVWDTRFAANDPFWVKKAGLQALSLAGQVGVTNPDKFIDDLETVFPQLKDSLEKKRADLAGGKEMKPLV